jgi:hypothetical protein
MLGGILVKIKTELVEGEGILQEKKEQLEGEMKVSGP